MEKKSDNDKINRNDNEKNVEKKSEPTIVSLKRVPPKRVITLDNRKPSLSRFIIDTPLKAEEPTTLKPVIPLPSFVFKPTTGNVGVGAFTLAANTTTSNLTAVGTSALQANT